MPIVTLWGVAKSWLSYQESRRERCYVSLRGGRNHTFIQIWKSSVVLCGLCKSGGLPFRDTVSDDQSTFIYCPERVYADLSQPFQRRHMMSFKYGDHKLWSASLDFSRLGALLTAEAYVADWRFGGGVGEEHKAMRMPETVYSRPGQGQEEDNLTLRQWSVGNNPCSSECVVYAL